MRERVSLFEAVCDAYTLQRAWTEVRDGRTQANRHRGAGVDGVTVAEWEADWQARLAALQAGLWQGTYRPSPLLWFDVPHPRPPTSPLQVGTPPISPHLQGARPISPPRAGTPLISPPRAGGTEGGRTRRLGIPTVTDRVAQRAVKNVLEPLWERVFLSCSHGFRPNRSVFTAVAHVLWYQAQGLCWVADADIEAYFDTITHRRLLSQLEPLGDERIVDLIAAWLEVGTLMPGRGMAQGAVISPLLANVYLHPFDVAMIRAGLALVRYADDLVVMCANPHDARRALELVAGALAELDLALNQDKTAIVPFGPHFRFLGAQFSNA